MVALSSSSALILPHIFRRPPPLCLLPLFKQLHKTSSLGPTTFISLLSPPLPLSRQLSLSSLPPPHSLALIASQEPTLSDAETEAEMGHQDYEDSEEESGGDDAISGAGGPPPGTSTTAAVVVDPKLSSKHRELMTNLQGMNLKEKKELASYAHSLGKKLKSQQIGKSGVTDAVGIALVETLEANELLKIKIHNSCPGELDDAVKQLEEATGSVVVGRTGRTVIIYRPSLTKLIAEEKKKQAQKIILKRRAAFNSSFQNRGRPSKPYVRNSQRGRRSSGSEEVESTTFSRGRRGTSRG